MLTKKAIVTLKSSQELGVTKYKYIPESEAMSAEKRQALVWLGYATYDMQDYPTFGKEHKEGQTYLRNMIIFKDNAQYICEPPNDGMQSSDTWVEAEWRKVLQGA